MGRKHDEAVNRIHNAYQEALNSEASPWDEIYKEQPYYRHEELGYENTAGQMHGEFDVAAIDYDRQIIRYVEVKTKPSQASYAEEQIERAEEYFAKIGWEVRGTIWIEP